MTAAGPVGTNCPMCRDPAGAVPCPEQAFCFNMECPIFTWNPLLTRDEIAEDMKVIDLSFLEDS